jgi:hypothetical protein
MLKLKFQTKLKTKNLKVLDILAFGIHLSFEL